MAETKTISPESKARRTAAGANNLKTYKATRAAAAEQIAAEVAEFRAALVSQIGADVTALQKAGIESACTIYVSILQTQVRLLAGQAGVARMNALHASLPVLTGSLLRVLRVLKVNIGTEPGDESEKAPTLAEWTEDWRRRQRAQVAAPDQEVEEAP